MQNLELNKHMCTHAMWKRRETRSGKSLRKRDEGETRSVTGGGNKMPYVFFIYRIQIRHRYRYPTYIT